MKKFIDQNQSVKIDKQGREYWYFDHDTNKEAFRKFDRRGNIKYYKNSNGVEIIRKFDIFGNLKYSYDSGFVIIDKRKTKFIIDRLNRLKILYKKTFIKSEIMWIFYKIKYRKELKQAEQQLKQQK